jgi:dTDP-4-dehydrorhamnose reductase
VSGGLLVIGRSGQLARALYRAGPEDLACAGRGAFDLAGGDAGALLDAHAPRAVINAAAFTDVDGAEDAREPAYELNAQGPARLAAACAQRGVRFLHVSTDYVFSGQDGGAPYAEDAPTHPLNVYGASKRAGEAAVMEANPQALILRVSWLFDEAGGTFLNAILKRAEAGGALKIVDDQVSAPTYAEDAAKALLALADTPLSGLFHFQGGEHASWRDFAIAALEEAGLLSSLGEPAAIPSSEWPRPAARPLDTRLDAAKLAREAGIGAGDWRRGVKAVIAARRAA